jgi:chemotaxis protein histidine kinase CheA
MAQPLSDYFALEASEFLDQLDGLLNRSDQPDFRQLFRMARGVRGSATIAGVPQVARVAERLEEAARELRDGQLAWGEEVRQRAVRTVDDLRVLVRAHPRWAADEETRANVAVERWSGLAGAERREAAAAHGGEQIFGFVQREIAQVVAELDRVVGELREAPTAREPLRSVLRRMRPVRGVAGMPALSPVLEVLEGIEDAAHEIMARALSADGHYLELLEAARDSLGAAGRHLAQGEAPSEGAELERFREVRDRGDGSEPSDAVPVSTLFVAGQGPHVVSSPMAPVPAAPGDVPGEVESFLRIEATGFLDRAEAMVAETRGRPNTRFSRVARQLADLAASVRELAATYSLDEIARAAAAAADALRSSTSGEAAMEAILDLRSALPGAPPRPPRVAVQPDPGEPAAEAPAAPPAAPGTAESGSGPSAADGDADGVVPVESLLYDAPGALREALALKPRVAHLVGAGAAPGTPLGEVMDELFGLVELGLQRSGAA